MFKHMLVPTDGSRHSIAATRFAVEFAEAINCRMTALAVVRPDDAGSGERAGTQGVTLLTQRQADAALRSATAIARSAGVAASTVILRHSEPATAILHAASTLNCDLVIMATHGASCDGAGQPVAGVGSQAMKVVSASTVPVLVYRMPQA